MDLTLSPNFSLKEFTRSETAMKKGFTENYTPSKEVIENLRKLALNVAEPIRKEWGSFSPTVAYRCKRLNDALGGAKQSQHLLGQAFDETFIHDGINVCDKVFFWLIKSNVPFTKLIWEKGNENCPNWLHIGYTECAKKEVLYTFDGKVYVNYFGSVLERHHKELKKC